MRHQALKLVTIPPNAYWAPVINDSQDGSSLKWQTSLDHGPALRARVMLREPIFPMPDCEERLRPSNTCKRSRSSIPICLNFIRPVDFELEVAKGINNRE